MSAAEFDPDARVEFLAAVAYYEECQAGLGRHFRVAVESAMEHIVEMPLRFRVLYTPFRRCLVPNIPYSLIFSIEPKFVLIIAVAHMRRKPGYWHGRVERYG